MIQQVCSKENMEKEIKGVIAECLFCKTSRTSTTRNDIEMGKEDSHKIWEFLVTFNNEHIKYYAKESFIGSISCRVNYSLDK